MSKSENKTPLPDNYLGSLYNDREEFIQRLKWMNKVRTMVGTMLFLFTIGLYLYFYYFRPQETIFFVFQKRLLVWTLLIEFIEVFINTPYLFLIKRIKKIELFGTIQATLDMLLITSFTYLFGGTDFPVSIVIYAFGIALIGFIFHKGMAYWLAFVSSASYCFITIGQNLNWIPLIRTTYWELGPSEQAIIIAFNIIVFFLMAHFSGDVVDMLESKILSLREVLAERDKLYIEQKKLLTGIRQSEENYRSIVDSMQEGLYRVDFEGNIEYSNPALLKMFGYGSLSEIRKINFKQVLPPEITMENVFEELFRLKTLNKYELSLKRKNGSFFPIILSSHFYYNEKQEIAGAEGIVSDLTERKQYEREIVKRKSFLENVLASVPEAVITIDLQGKVIEWNKGAETTFLYKKREALGNKIDVLLNPENIPEIKEEAKKYTEKVLNGKRIISVETTRFRKDKTSINVMFSATPINIDNKAIAIVVAYEDITVAKESEEALLASLQEKKVLLKEIHHRVKNNLQIISSLLYLQSRNIEDDEMAALFTDSRNRITSMALIHEKLYRSEDLSNIPFEEYIRELIAEIVSSYSQKDSQVNVHFEIDPIHLAIDIAIPCGLIINELVSNSMKYAFPNGVKQLGTGGPVAKSNTIFVSLKKIEPNRAALILFDNGKGFPEEINFRETTSLGLQLVNSLVSQLEGEIDMYNEKGTKFEIRFIPE